MYEHLSPLGWTSRLSALAADLDRDRDREFTCGRIARVDRGMATMLTDADRDRRVTFGNDRITIGDWVAVDDAGRIAHVFDRTAVLRRMAAGERVEAQLIAANVDRVFILQSLKPGPNLRRLERELVVAWDSGAVPIVLLTKADLIMDSAAFVKAAQEVSLGVEVIAISARTGAGLDAVHDQVRPNLTAVAIGASGAGKSTLVNALLGEERQDTGDVREDDQRGRHTTSASALIRLPGGGIYLDTPGIRSVGLWTDEEALAAAFSDIREFAANCRFDDCAHHHEPGCAVMEAIESEELTADRLVSWRKLQEEVAHLRDERPGWKKAGDSKKRGAFGHALRDQPFRQ